MNCSLIDSLSRIRMTAVLAVDARHDRDAEVDGLARHPQLEAAVLRHALLGDVELRHDLDARNDRAVEALVDRPHCRLQHAVDAVLHVDRVFLRLDMDVARAPLDRTEDGRIDQPDDRALVGRQLLHRQLIVAAVVFAEDLHLEALGRFLQHARRALALLEHRLDGRRGADRHLDRRAEKHGELVDHRQVGWIRHDDDERVPVAVIRHEAVAEHQVRRNGAEEFVVDAGLRQVDELEPVAVGQPLRRARLRPPSRQPRPRGCRRTEIQPVRARSAWDYR